MNRKLTFTGANIVFFVFSLLFIVYQLAFVILFGEEFFTGNIYLTLAINELILILLPVIIYALIKKVNFKETFRFNKFTPIQALLIAAMSVTGYFFASLLNSIVVYFLQFIGDIPAQPIPVPQNIYELIAGIFFVAVLPGICEEMMHRGMLLRAYERRGSVKAVIITSILFGIFHFDITNLLGPVFLGLLIGYYVIRTNSIFAGMLAHFLNNTIAELLQFFWGEDSIQETVTVSARELGEIFILGMAGLLGTLFLLKVFKRITEGRAVMLPAISSVKRDVVSVISHWPIILIALLYFIMTIMYLLSIIVMKFGVIPLDNY